MQVVFLYVIIIKKSDNEAIVDIRQPSSIDTNRAIDFLGVIIKNEENKGQKVNTAKITDTENVPNYEETTKEDNEDILPVHELPTPYLSFLSQLT